MALLVSSTSQPDSYPGTFSELCTELFRANPTPSLLVSCPSGLIVLVNESFEEYTGYSADSLIARSIADIPCCSDESFQELVEVLGDAKETDGHECRLTHRDGHLLPAIASARSLLHEGVPHRVISITDISELKMTEVQLRRSERLYRELYEGSRDGCVFCDLSGRILGCNQSFADMLGRTPEECCGLHYTHITPNGWHDSEERVLSKQLSLADSTQVYEREYVRKDGKLIPVELRAHLRRDINGVPIGLWAFVRDISVRKRAEYERRANELKFKSLTEESLVAVVIYNGDRVCYANRTMAELLQMSPGELIGLPSSALMDTIHPDDRPRITQAVEELLSGPELKWRRAAFRVCRNDGEVRYLDGYSRMGCLDGRPHIVCHVLDVTDTHLAFEKLRRNNDILRSQEKALESKNIALQTVLAQLDQDKLDMSRALENNARMTIMPLLEALDARCQPDQAQLVGRLREAVDELLSPFIGSLKAKHPALSPREIEVCDLIRRGRTSREIAAECGVAESTVAEWRKRIRRKLGLTSRRINLAGHLRRVGG